MTDSATTSLFAGGPLRLFGVAFAALLAVACFTDLRARRIPNKLVLVLAATGIAFSLVAEPSLGGFGRAVSGLVVGFALWIVFYVLRVLGAGDVKLAAAIGTWLGPSGVWRASLIAALVGGVIALGILVYERRLRRTLERLAVSASVRPLTPIEASVQATSETPARRVQMPYGIALAIGAAVAAWMPRLLS